MFEPLKVGVAKLLNIFKEGSLLKIKNIKGKKRAHNNNIAKEEQP